MSPTWMLTMLLSLFAAFCWSANRRYQLLKVGRDTNRLDRLWERLKGTLSFALLQKRMPDYPLAGIAHIVIFFGFLILLLRTLTLWGRGFDPDFGLWVLGEEPTHLPLLGAVPLGHIYDFTKDVVATLVLAAALVFLYLRLVKHEPRMTQSGEAVLILVIISVMMVADMAYDGAAQVLHGLHLGPSCTSGTEELCASVTTVTSHRGPTPEADAIAWAPYPAPAGSFFAVLFGGLGASTLVTIAHLGFWTHATLVMIFLNILPHSKHFHVITVFPNVFTRDLELPGKLAYVGSSESIGEKVMAAYDNPATAEPIGVARIEHFTWKALLDFYTCTECGRCSDACPAHRTGKILSPKLLTINLRDHLYGRETEFLDRPGGPRPNAEEDPHHGAEGHGEEHAAEGEEHAAEHGDAGDDHHHAPQPENPNPNPDVASKPVDLVGEIIHPDVLWACTTCRACEEACPVTISYVDKIVAMRRNLMLIKGELPPELATPLGGLDTNGNPWNLSRMDRGAWAEGLDIPTAAEKPNAPVLFWVGCAASYDDRAKKTARATARLMKEAGVDFVILGEEESCTGDPARRAGDEYRFAMMAEANIATLDGYKAQGGVKTIVTACPHCFNTLANEYPDFGGKYEVVHHSELLLDLVKQGKLKPVAKVKGKVAFHDSCYLGRYNDIYDQPRDILASIPGLELCEVVEASRNKGLCCGAGGMQMFMEEQNRDRMNVRRTKQLLATGADCIATACPFCTTMITDGLKDQEKEDDVRQLDIAELLLQSCALDKPAAARESAS